MLRELPSDGGRMTLVTASGSLQVSREDAQRRWKVVDSNADGDSQLVDSGSLPLLYE